MIPHYGGDDAGLVTRVVTKPGTPEWVGAIITTKLSRRYFKWQLLGALGLLSPLAPASLLWMQGGDDTIALGALLCVAPFAWLATLWRKHRHQVIFFPNPVLRGVPIRGEGRALLDDIAVRFEYAERLVDEVPTGIDWDEIDDDVQAVLWDAAEHAAHVSALDGELDDMHYAAAGTPQAVLKHRLEERREEHRQVLLGHQRDADSLARAAGNALAAAKVALAATGSLSALEVAAPSPRAMRAKGALAEARARLALLADVWAELDETTDLVAEKYGITGELPSGRSERER